jgi:hypothetical protein
LDLDQKARKKGGLLLQKPARQHPTSRIKFAKHPRPQIPHRAPCSASSPLHSVDLAPPPLDWPPATALECPPVVPVLPLHLHPRRSRRPEQSTRAPETMALRYVLLTAAAGACIDWRLATPGIRVGRLLESPSTTDWPPVALQRSLPRHGVCPRRRDDLSSELPNKATMTTG